MGVDGRSDDVRRPAAGAGEGRGGGTVRGLQACGYKHDRRYLQHGLAEMPGETGRLSASVPTPP